MSVGVTGDFAQLTKLAQELEAIGSSEFRRSLMRVWGEEAKTQIQLGFEDGRDPYDKPWAPVKLRPGGRPLRNTGRLMNSFSATSTDSGFTVATNAEYAATHQYGATIKAKKAGRPLTFKTPSGWRSKYSVTVPPRPMVPDSKRGLGPRWYKAFQDVADGMIRRRFGRGQ